jgi:hypothetical protein
MLANYLGPDLGGAPQIQSSPLYALDGNFATVIVDRTTENVFVKGSWPVVLPHLRLALGHRYYLRESYRYSILTDERIINVYVGNEGYKARSKNNDGSFNGLKDLVEAPDLVVVRLGFLGYRNKAAPGALKQALMLREAALKPTWVVQNPANDAPVSWDDEIAAYIQEHFDVVDLRKAKTPTAPEPPSTMAVEEHQTKLGTVKQKPAKPSELVPTHDSDPMGEFRTGISKPGAFRRPAWKKRRDDDDNRGGGGDMPPV